MTNPAIKVSHLGKRYKIGALQRRSDTMRDVLAGAWQRWLRPQTHGNGGGEANSFWALDDVTFDVQPGEVLGVIGRNGAGKSTLLKILARITEPTLGEVDLRGRVGSLLEVGTGFHAELSGRENIFLNGAILGMRRREISAKFDEIVDFSGVEQFIDTPVKRYSSGMYMRLAFAVAAHLETEILLVDEVLAVGDAEFQKKCLGKMGEVAKDGRTVVFVSHQLNAVTTLCDHALLLEQGALRSYGSANDVVGQYSGVGQGPSEWVPKLATDLDNPYFRPTRVVLIDQNQTVLSREISADELFGVLIEGLTKIVDVALTVGFALFAATGELLFWALQTDVNVESWPRINCGVNKLVCSDPAPSSQRRTIPVGAHRQPPLHSLAVSAGFEFAGDHICDKRRVE